MKIIQVITLSEPIGGAQMVLFNNTEAMVKSGHEVQVMVGQEGTLTKRLEALNVKVTCIPSLKREISPINDFKCYKTICELLKQEAPDIVISHSSKAGILCRLACHKIGVPNIFTVHGWSFTPGVKGLKRYVYMAIEKVMGRFTDHLITVSAFDFNLASKHSIVPESRMRVIYNGSPDFLKEERKEAKEDPITILMTARFSYQKDHMTLFKALQSLKDAPIQVDLVGHGDLHQEFVDLSKKMKIDHLITFHGESNDIPSFLNKSDIFVLTSRFEGLPLSICEAMSVGVPIVASDVGGVHEMVRDGYNGYLIPKENPNHLAEKLSNLIRDKELMVELGENSRKTFLETFSTHQMAASTEKYIEDILKKSSAK
ncbi:glycosyl transferase group 1 [Allomuricauda ruestringensis DSM 13258]|uniref:Glycosyl transferase group 1 n=1 Tax=Allomuricauda ruestringensis (strain DSM 13258 / CIP 107369 / LMG 19739 / B1) TaxID=886377 RepID=G2PNI2_ALLRU|nr:glycosyltransferase family 4 protein [Allomuricauda ruestringensis]AEM71362.1 glycosyl transferase group 1 [Allomuricauda ruestringensis DSM 13258]